jgi:hypothetical protein
VYLFFFYLLIKKEYFLKLLDDLNLKLSLANQLADKKTEEANKLLETINIYKKLDEELIKKNEVNLTLFIYYFI